MPGRAETRCFAPSELRECVQSRAQRLAGEVEKEILQVTRPNPQVIQGHIEPGQRLYRRIDVVGANFDQPLSFDPGVLEMREFGWEILEWQLQYHVIVVVLQQFVRRTVCNDLSVIHDRDAIAQHVRFFHIVRRQHDRRSIALYRLDHVPEVAARLRVQAGGRLVQKHEGRIVDQRNRKQQSLPLPTGQFARVAVEDIAEGAGLDQGVALIRAAVEPVKEFEGLSDRQEILQSRALELYAGLLVKLAPHRFAAKVHLAGSRGDDAFHHLDSRCLAGAIRAEKADALSGFDGERYPVDGAHAGVVHDQIADFENRRRRDHDHVIIRWAATGHRMNPDRHASAQLSLLDGAATSPLHTSGMPLKIRQSARAKRLILQVVPPGRLEVVVPRGIGARAVEAFLAESRAWIDAARRELGMQDTSLSGAAEAPLPAVVQLPAVGKCFDVEYSAGRAPAIRWREGHLEIVHCEGTAEARALLRRWLMARGRDWLKPWLLEEAARLDAPPSGVQVRLQRTRWGSCSSQRRISLNAALLLVDAPLVRYLFVHELCHLNVMNHSQRFWERVGRFSPDYRACDQALGKAWRRLPAWLFDE